MILQRIGFFIVWIALTLSSTCSNGQISPQLVEIRGIYGHPAPLWDAGYQLNELGINAIFVHSGSINDQMMERAREEGLKVYAEFATLNGKGYVEKNPGAHAIDDRGNPVEPASWFMGVCPTNSGFRAYRYQQLRDLLAKFELGGIWMDYVHWHAQFEEAEPILPETCFCEDCLAAFSHHSGLKIDGTSIPEKAQWIMAHADSTWRDWRCDVVLQWATEIKEILAEVRPGALLGLYHCPWTDDEFNQARYRILGLDYDRLAQVVDVYSPMVYHGRMERHPEWVGDNIQWHTKKLEDQLNDGARLWPIVQAYNDPKVISDEEFETVLKGGLSGRSSGIMMFTTRAIADDPAKIEVMRRLYFSLSKQ